MKIYTEKKSKYVVEHEKALMPTILYVKKEIGDSKMIRVKFKFWHYFYSVTIFYK